VFSHYDYAYSNVSESIDDIEAGQSDVYSIAASRLHVSVLPDKLPCREVLLDTVVSYY
jgi:hypothetical protein